MSVAINHIVLNVRDIEESHRFWTELIGFTHVGDNDGALNYSVQLPTEGALTGRRGCRRSGTPYRAAGRWISAVIAQRATTW